MNILFLTLVDFNSISDENLYADLMREFTRHGHHVYIVSPVERRKGQPTRLIREENATILKLKIGNTQKTNIIEKGISTLTIEPLFIAGIKKHFADVKFDLVIYSTPPITFCRAIEYVKRRDGAKTYLLLKDIFPQNAVDIGMMKTTGIKGLLYRFFRNKEKKLYAISDRIGCMSQANVDYLLRHNPSVSADKVEVCPNSIEFVDLSVSAEERTAMREKYGLPQDKKIFVYGGNLGKPQGIPFVLDCLRAEASREDAFFLIVGDGTEYGKLEAFMHEQNPQNARLMQRLPKEDYDRLVAACDVGMIFLDCRFTIPNFPSRLLSCMQAALPVLACTDPNTDLGKVITDGGFGWWCESNDVAAFSAQVDAICKTDDFSQMKEAETAYLKEHYTVDKSYQIMMG